MPEDQQDIIDVYTDDDAIKDGTLVELYMPAMFRNLPINRMTSNLFADLEPLVEAYAEAHHGSFFISLSAILRTKCEFAQGDPGNSGAIGDIYRIPPKLWLVRNEMDGWTAMHPEDY